MKTLLLASALFTASCINAVAAPSSGVAPGDSATYKLTVGFANVTKRSGMIYVGVVNKAADFDGNFCRKTRISVPATGEFQVNFEGLPAGQYAVEVFQDLNDNQKLDFTGRVATEPFGFSNVKMLLGAPSFNESAFELSASKTITLNLLGI